MNGRMRVGIAIMGSKPISDGRTDDKHRRAIDKDLLTTATIVV